jgi:DNA-binding FadR family transcriptional regulator
VTTPQIGKIQRSPPLSEVVQREIKAYILQHGLRTGDPLPSEVALATQLGVSRNSVREAVKVLSTFGLLEARIGSGLFVGRLALAPILDNLTFGLSDERDEFAEAIETRRWLELGLVDDLVAAITKQQLAEMEELLRQWRRETEAGLYPPERDRGFHHLVVSSAGNGLASRLLDLLWDVRQRAHEAGAIEEPRDLMANLVLHERIFDALSRRNAPDLRAAVIGHYDFVLAEVVRTPAASPRARSGTAPGKRKTKGAARSGLGKSK